jgi:hypothetical protein
MLFCKKNKSIFHIHIPRTGGRYINSIFKLNKFKPYHNNFNTTVQGIEVPHLHYPLYNFLEGVEDTENHFTIVRDPFERFKSAMKVIINSRSYPEEIYELIQNKSWLFEFLDFEREVNSYKYNFFRPQCEFISNKTTIYRFEDGLGDNFLEWLNNTFDIYLKSMNFKYNLADSELLECNQEINVSIKNLIKEYYKSDYDYFNYD